MDNSGRDWPVPPPHLKLPGEEVHVWLAKLDAWWPALPTLNNSLSRPELEHAAKFRFEREQKNFAAGRGLLRLILSRYLNIAAADLQFDYGFHGKPKLAGAGAASNLNFNLSHSGLLAVFAFALVRNVGVDLEEIAPLVEMDDIAQRYFSAEENARLSVGPRERRPELFFQIWTRKEAVLKCDGHGFGDEGRIQQACEQFQGVVCPLNISAGYVAHLAISTPARLRTWRLESQSFAAPRPVPNQIA
jgi:4'-phosphopantetheinyl transferase